MTWIKLQDNAPRHPKISVLSDRAFRFWIHSLCYASEFLTDGVLPVAFLVTVPRKVQEEIITAGLWTDGVPVTIHDYLEHQRDRAAVLRQRDGNKHRQNKFRNAPSNAVTNGVTNGVSNAKVTALEKSREEKSTELETTPPASSHRGGGLIPSPAQIYRLQQTHAFVGSKLRIPHVLHSELMAKSGADADAALRDWYAELDAELEQSGKATGDVFVWIRPRHQAFAVSKGWIDAAPKPKPQTASRPIELPRHVTLGRKL